MDVAGARQATTQASFGFQREGYLQQQAPETSAGIPERGSAGQGGSSRPVATRAGRGTEASGIFLSGNGSRKTSADACCMSSLPAALP